MLCYLMGHEVYFILFIYLFIIHETDAQIAQWAKKVTRLIDAVCTHYDEGKVDVG